MNDSPLDARIGMLNGGRFYAYVHGYNSEPVVGALAEVENALGLKLAVKRNIRASRDAVVQYDVLMRFQYPAWDEQDGVLFDGIVASSRSEANRIARRRAMEDGHSLGRGRVYFTATEKVVHKFCG